MTTTAIRCLASAFALLLISQSTSADSPLRFHVSVSPEICPAPVSGRLFVFVSQKKRALPMRGPQWFQPEPFFGRDFQDVSGGATLEIDEQADGFPAPLAELPAGHYRVQALFDHDFYQPSPADGPGNFHSGVVEIDHDPARPQVVELRLDQRIEEEPFPDHPRVKEVVIASRKLAEFHGRDVLERAAVVLPLSYDEQPNRRYPVLYLIPGFGGSHRDALGLAARKPKTDTPPQVEFIYVMLSGRCKWGHHVYADSATNGPRGAALIEETIPEIDRQFRTVAAPTARFVGGHSSGGWSSLWLQVNYPDTFGGVWSTAPDPVDFRDFQRVDLYTDPPTSVYVDATGTRRPLGRMGGRTVMWFDTFTKMEDVLARGGQLRSFEAVFSPLGSDGLPRKAYDRATGIVDPEVARAWQDYDLRLILEREWSTLGPKLQGKLHVTVGEEDTFFLEGAVHKLAETLTQLGSDAEITFVPEANHMNLTTPALIERRLEQMTSAYLRHHALE